MLIEFRVTNFRSIGEEQILSLAPAENQKEFQENILSQGNLRALNLLSIYGANGSGKSNLMKAVSLFLHIIRTSAKSSSTDKLPYDPFLLRQGWKEKPTIFELVFAMKGVRYRYGYTYNETGILKEELNRKNVGREVNVFNRENDIIDPSSSLKGNAKLIDAAIEATRENGLFLSALDMLNIEEANEIFKLLTRIASVDGTDTKGLTSDSPAWKNGIIKDAVKSQVKRLKLGMIDIDAQEETFDETTKTQKRFKIIAKHIIYDKEGQPTPRKFSWDFFKRESSGSKKALELAAPIMAILAVGGVLLIDEIEANMHPLITLDTINLFLNKDTNPKDAQLIFTTHDTNLLSYSNLRRDQIYFAEKNKWESTEIYSLSDFVYVEDNGNKVGKERPDSDKEKRYIEGRFGAIPVFGKLQKYNLDDNG